MFKGNSLAHLAELELGEVEEGRAGQLSSS